MTLAVFYIIGVLAGFFSGVGADGNWWRFWLLLAAFSALVGVGAVRAGFGC